MIRLYGEAEQEKAEGLSRRGFFGLTALLVAEVVAPNTVFSFPSVSRWPVYYADTDSLILYADADTKFTLEAVRMMELLAGRHVNQLRTVFGKRVGSY